MKWLTKGVPFAIISAICIGALAWFALGDRLVGDDQAVEVAPTTTVPIEVGPTVVPDSDPRPTPEGETPTSIPPPVFAEVPIIPAPEYPDAECTPAPVFQGWATVWRNWGNIRLPYGVGWPTNEPGRAPSCTLPQTGDPGSDIFVAAVSAAHVAFIDQFNPEQIPMAAAATPGRDVRVQNHQGFRDPTQLEFVCEPIGWRQGDATSTVVIAVGIRCGDNPVQVMDIPMSFDDGRWYGVYPSTGKFTLYKVTDEMAGQLLYAYDTGGE